MKPFRKLHDSKHYQELVRKVFGSPEGEELLDALIRQHVFSAGPASDGDQQFRAGQAEVICNLAMVYYNE
jgi:hypothetical protein